MKRATLPQVIRGERKWVPADVWPISLPGIWFEVPEDTRPPPGWGWVARGEVRQLAPQDHRGRHHQHREYVGGFR